MADFDNFDTELEKVLQAAERGMKKAVIKFQADTQMITHVDTGTLRRSWTHKTEKQGDNIIQTAICKRYQTKSSKQSEVIQTVNFNNVREYIILIFKNIVKQIIINEMRTDDDYNLAYLNYQLDKYKEEINSGKAVISTSPKGANLRELKQFFR